MDQCCEIRTDVPARQRRVLQVVLWLNSLMFIAESGAGLAAHSTALLPDSVDMFGDAIVYGFSLFAIARGTLWQARVAMLKGLIMAAFGVGVLIEVGHKLATGVLPTPGLMSAVGFIALGANTVCLILLSRHRADDINMRSAWLCSRNDVIANAGVLVAAGGGGTLVRITSAYRPEQWSCLDFAPPWASQPPTGSHSVAVSAVEGAAEILLNETIGERQHLANSKSGAVVAVD